MKLFGYVVSHISAMRSMIQGHKGAKVHTDETSSAGQPSTSTSPYDEKRPDIEYIRAGSAEDRRLERLLSSSIERLSPKDSVSKVYSDITSLFDITLPVKADLRKDMTLKFLKQLNIKLKGKEFSDRKWVGLKEDLDKRNTDEEQFIKTSSRDNIIEDSVWESIEDVGKYENFYLSYGYHQEIVEKPSYDIVFSALLNIASIPDINRQYRLLEYVSSEMDTGPLSSDTWAEAHKYVRSRLGELTQKSQEGVNSFLEHLKEEQITVLETFKLTKLEKFKKTLKNKRENFCEFSVIPHHGRRSCDFKTSLYIRGFVEDGQLWGTYKECLGMIDFPLDEEKNLGKHIQESLSVIHAGIREGEHFNVQKKYIEAMHYKFFQFNLS